MELTKKEQTNIVVSNYLSRSESDYKDSDSNSNQNPDSDDDSQANDERAEISLSSDKESDWSSSWWDYSNTVGQLNLYLAYNVIKSTQNIET